MSELSENPFPSRARPVSADDPSTTAPLFPVPVNKEDETAMFIPQGPVPTPHDYTPRRIPHFGHALLFVGIAFVLLMLSQLTLLTAGHISATTAKMNMPPKLLVGSEAITYLTTLGISWFLFPLLWMRTFPDGIEANPAAAQRNWFRLIPIGLTLSFIVQAVSSLATMPKDIPMDDFFRTRSDVWIITVFGIFVAPLFEEILFRGFLLPAFAIAYDWLSLPRTPAAREIWKTTNRLSLPSLIFSGILTSILFTWLHGQQVAYAWPVMLLLFCVSLVLTAVRVRLRSVMASTLVHASYNFTVFLLAFIGTDGYRHLDKMTH